VTQGGHLERKLVRAPNWFDMMALKFRRQLLKPTEQEWERDLKIMREGTAEERCLSRSIAN
jgi:hypothetical protein